MDGTRVELGYRDESYSRCVRCNWPLCSVRCQDSPLHDPECRATRAAGSRIKVEVFGQVREISLENGKEKANVFTGSPTSRNFWSKNYNFLFMLPFDQEASKTYKNIKKCVLSLSRSCQR